MIRTALSLAADFVAFIVYIAGVCGLVIGFSALLGA
jgi:hypothetical protein